jgi:eukaryotic-like serine/threonine-protein kinase
MSDPISHLQQVLADRYELEREVGAGGMATVYLARDLKHDRKVAIKVLRPELAAALGPDRFLREVKITAALNHPHILPLLDSGDADGMLFYVMPFVEGESLRDRLVGENQLPLDEAMRITYEVAGALGFAHKAGVIHRDIKPDNILISAGHAVVADFGIARAVSAAGGQRLTETGLSLGTPSYMSPEQATGGPKIDARSDIYSLASVLYEMLAGEPPFSGPTSQSVIAKLMTEPPPSLRTLRDTVPVEMDTVVMAALAKAPADRFADADAFVAALQSATVAQSAPAPVTSSPKSKVALIGVAALAIGAIVVGVVAIVGRGPSETLPQTRRQLTLTGTANFPALSPDGQWIAFVSEGRDLMVQEVSGGRAISVGPEAVQIGPPQWSPDGSQLLFGKADSTGASGLYTVPRLGGVPRRVGEPRLAVAYDYHPNGNRIAVVYVVGDENHWIRIVDRATGAVFDSVTVGSEFDFVQSVEWSPGGAWIAFQGYQGDQTILGVASPDGGAVKRVAQGSMGPEYANFVRWGPRGDDLYVVRPGQGQHDLVRHGIDPRSGEQTDRTVVLSGFASTTSFDISADGRTVASASGAKSSQLWALTLTPAGGPVTARQLTRGTAGYYAPDISPDGQRVAFGSLGGVSVMPFDGGTASPMLSSAKNPYLSRWSPDGQRLAFFGETDDGTFLMVGDVPEGRVRQLGNSPVGGPPYVAWFPGGQRIIYQLAGAGRFAVFDLQAQSEAEIVLGDSTSLAFYPVASPSGGQIVMAVLEGSTFALVTVSLMDGTRTTLASSATDGIAPLLWTADGWIYVVRVLFSGVTRRIERIRASGGEPELYAELPVECYASEQAAPSLSWDARHVVCVVKEQRPDIWVVENFDPTGR